MLAVWYNQIWNVKRNQSTGEKGVTIVDQQDSRRQLLQLPSRWQNWKIGYRSRVFLSNQSHSSRGRQTDQIKSSGEEVGWKYCQLEVALVSFSEIENSKSFRGIFRSLFRSIVWQEWRLLIILTWLNGSTDTLPSTKGTTIRTENFRLRKQNLKKKR